MWIWLKKPRVWTFLRRPASVKGKAHGFLSVCVFWPVKYQGSDLQRLRANSSINQKTEPYELVIAVCYYLTFLSLEKLLFFFSVTQITADRSSCISGPRFLGLIGCLSLNSKVQIPSEICHLSLFLATIKRVLSSTLVELRFAKRLTETLNEFFRLDFLSFVIPRRLQIVRPLVCCLLRRFM